MAIIADTSGGTLDRWTITSAPIPSNTIHDLTNVVESLLERVGQLETEVSYLRKQNDFGDFVKRHQTDFEDETLPF